MVESIQFLRAIAVFLVLFFHANGMVNVQAGYGGYFTSTGASGVDLFFVISGFVIFLVSGKKDVSPWKFLARRVIRVGPLYWLYTTITVALLIFVPNVFKSLKFELIPTINSYFFILSKKNTGGIGTVLGVGWTIAYEMYFYVLFFISMLLMPRMPFKLVAATIAGGAFISLFIDIEHRPAFSLVSLNTLPLEFLAGCFIAKRYTQGVYLNYISSIIAIAVGLFGIWYSGMTGKVSSAHDVLRAFYYGLPAALIVYGFVSLDASKLIKIHRGFLMVGDSSYSIYLCHPLALAVICKLWEVLSMKPIFHSEVLLTVGILFSIIAGLISYRIIERPITNALNTALAR